jgi:8-oxo-dGTP pyrophosphatase MutT (NUDIX family)
MILEHPLASVSTEQVNLPNGQVTMDWPKIYTHDYVNVLVLNDDEEAMIIESYNNGNGWSGWQVIGGYLEDGEDPYKAVQRQLQATGYDCTQWLYLGSYTIDAEQHVGVGHFFYATGAHLVAHKRYGKKNKSEIKWVSIKDLKYALLDGRINVMSYAANIALALLLIDRQPPQ